MAEKKVVVVMGATGTGKSRLAIDLASHFAGVEILNSDSMQVYRGLDILTNKVPLSERKGVPHHLLGTVDSSAEFTCKDFRDLAIPVIDDILSRNGLPVIVGGTNFYIQALVSPFLFDDMVEDLHECPLTAPLNEIAEGQQDPGIIDAPTGYERLREIDPVAANRIHPNDHRKISRYLSLYASSGALPSNLFQGEAAKKWGRASKFRYSCCFICLDASLHVLDRYVDKRVDSMIEAGLLNEVCDVYDPNAVYTQGLRQAIGVREFDRLFRSYLSNQAAAGDGRFVFSDIKNLDEDLKGFLHESINNLKVNTRRLVRRQRRRLSCLSKDFGWDLHYIDTTDALFCTTGCSWEKKVVEPCVDIITTFLFHDTSSSTCIKTSSQIQSQELLSRDLWVQYVCEACGDRILRGAHEWEQHTRGRGHRKRILQLKKKNTTSYFADCQQHVTSTDSFCT